MRLTFDEILQAALALSEEDRKLLICHLQDDPVSRSEEYWRKEVARRSAEIDAGLVECISWEDVKAEVHRKYLED